jgi:hypothetical protein
MHGIPGSTTSEELVSLRNGTAFPTSLPVILEQEHSDDAKPLPSFARKSVKQY